MAFIKSELLDIYQKELNNLTSVGLIFNENNQKLLEESIKDQIFEFDIFLSHSYIDNKYVFGIFNKLCELGYKVYVDWIVDTQLERNSVNEATANTLRNRMKKSKSLFYLTSENSSKSKWMPWELGFMDGYNEKVAILPILNTQKENWKFTGQEYLGIYPYVIEEYQQISNLKKLWICESEKKYILFDHWILGFKPFIR